MSDLQVGILSGLGPGGGSVISQGCGDFDYDYGFFPSSVCGRLRAAAGQGNLEQLVDRLVVYRLTAPRQTFRGGAITRYATDVDLLDPHNPEHEDLWKQRTGRGGLHPAQRMDCPKTRNGAHSLEMRTAPPCSVSFFCSACQREFPLVIEGEDCQSETR